MRSAVVTMSAQLILLLLGAAASADAAAAMLVLGLGDCPSVLTRDVACNDAPLP